ncbi:MAG: hypothetical protein KDC66_00350 [Phaeodactylibacter sp.]|nr:hypothetical protein [Phaeodactylibacter sp.]MCB9275696.1 hypothetical protein [Lewinellaceae bacterium]
MNTKRWMAIIMGLLLAAPAFSQLFDDEPVKGEVGSKIQAARVAYITQRLGLTPGESERFWALNNEFESEQDKIKAKYKSGQALEAMTDKEVEQYLDGRMQMEQELLNLKRDYIQRFKGVLSPRKIILFQRADKEFRLELLRRVQERRDNANRPFRRPGAGNLRGN